MSANPDLRCFPSADASFAAFVRRCARTLASNGELSTAGLQQLVRDRYPTATVRAQQPMARERGEAFRWYVYREVAPWLPDAQGD